MVVTSRYSGRSADTHLPINVSCTCAGRLGDTAELAHHMYRWPYHRRSGRKQRLEVSVASTVRELRGQRMRSSMLRTKKTTLLALETTKRGCPKLLSGSLGETSIVVLG